MNRMGTCFGAVADGVAVIDDGAVEEEAQAYDEDLKKSPDRSCICSCGWVVDPVNMISLSLCITRKGSEGLKLKAYRRLDKNFIRPIERPSTNSCNSRAEQVLLRVVEMFRISIWKSGDTDMPRTPPRESESSAATCIFMF
jgi:hypothetical protein